MGKQNDVSGTDFKNPGIVATMCTQTSGTQGIEHRGLLAVTQVVERVILNGAVMRKEDFL